MRTALFAALLLTVPSPALAQTPSDEGGRSARPPLEALLSEWRAGNGTGWRMRVDERAQALELLHGGQTEGPLRPQSEAEWFAQARHFLSLSQGLHRISTGTLLDDKALLLALGQGNTTDKMTVRLRQEVAGVPVEDASVNLLFTPSGDLLSIHNRALAGLTGFVTRPGIAASDAARTVARLFRSSHATAPTGISTPELIIRRHDGAGGLRPVLAWRIDARSPGVDAEPISFRYWVDAQNGTLLERVNRVHHFDVGGRLMTVATPGLAPDTPGNPPVATPAPFVEIASNGAGSAFTDADGYFNFPGVTTPLDVSVAHSGTFVNVTNDPMSAPTYAESFAQVPVGTTNQIVMNSAAAPLVTAEANALLGCDAVRDFIKTTLPTDTSLDFLVQANTNLPQDCNAYYDGISINFFTEGSGCVNTSFSTVVAHELGHWMNDIYGTFNGFDGMGEGNADVWAMYTFDDPVVGMDFAGPGAPIRDGRNTVPYCGDSTPACYGQVHADGMPWMGAAWKIRRNLNTTHGNAVGDMLANALFLGWMNGYDQSEIHSLIEAQWLTLDDDDGNIDNGTPNYLDIDSAFREQGFPGFDLTWVTFQGVTAVADTVDETGPYTIDGTLAATSNPPVMTASLTYTVDAGPPVTIPMTQGAGSLWSATIPGQMAPSEVSYQLHATDALGGTNDYPPRADRLDFRVGVITVAHATDFEAATDEGWTVGAASDTATTGVWERQDPRGTGAQPEDDHSAAPGEQCWFTEQGPASGSLGDADVDGGETTLFSPLFNVSNLFDPRVSYWRWYSNNRGAEPNADTLVIDISNDGGASWVNAEIVGPAGPEANGGWQFHRFRIADFVTPTATMQVRFIASDLAGGSIVEAAIDDFVADDLAPVTCVPSTSYCSTSPNSVGSGATLVTTGSQSVSANTFGLRLDGAPANSACVGFYGKAQSNAPFGDGVRCVGGRVFRMPPTLTDALGGHQELLNLNTPSHPLGQISAGQTWNFQFWFADPAGPGGTGSNTSDGIQATFCN